MTDLIGISSDRTHFQVMRERLIAKQAKKQAQRAKRFAPLPPSLKDESGQRLCRWCKKPVPKGRRTFCGNDCVHEFKIRSDANYIRAQLMKRDKGICAQCGLDTLELGKRAWEARRCGFEHYEALTRQYKGLRLPAAHASNTGRKLWFQADHIVEVVNGGGHCGLSNLQTLCLACHKLKTTRLAAERAAARRQAQPASLTLFSDQDAGNAHRVEQNGPISQFTQPTQPSL